jgi:hypothetical protein
VFAPPQRRIASHFVQEAAWVAEIYLQAATGQGYDPHGHVPILPSFFPSMSNYRRFLQFPPHLLIVPVSIGHRTNEYKLPMYSFLLRGDRCFTPSSRPSQLSLVITSALSIQVVSWIPLPILLLSISAFARL